jgi:hypothetical protein
MNGLRLFSVFSLDCFFIYRSDGKFRDVSNSRAAFKLAMYASIAETIS